MAKAPAGDFDYDRNGHGYAAFRRPDPRIASLVREALGESRTIVNVGAGAGSYEPPDRYVLAVEPSAVMRSQRPAHLAPAIDGVAAHLPLDDGAVDAAMAMVTIHQWPDAAAGLREMRRVARGPVVIMTFDGDVMEKFWLTDYAPGLLAAERSRYPAITEIQEVLGGTSEVITVPLAADCTDGFAEAYYARPEMFLDPAARGAQSAWGFISVAEQEASVNRLRADVESGAWQERYAGVVNEPFYYGSLRLVAAQPGSIPNRAISARS
jgi:SAM-dependent methyltransferase